MRDVFSLANDPTAVHEVLACGLLVYRIFVSSCWETTANFVDECYPYRYEYSVDVW